jgi:hypothetical protein
MRRLLCIGVVLACGCGYGFANRRSVLPTEGKRVYAPAFLNSTSEAGLDGVFTDAFRSELASMHADGPSDAAVQARGEVTSLGGGPGLPFTRVAPGGSGAEVSSLASYSVAASACIRLVDGGKVLGSTCVSGSEDYPPGADALQIEAARRVALSRLARRLMKEAIDRLASDF